MHSEHAPVHENASTRIRTHVRKIFPIRNFGKFENTFPVHTYLIDARTKNKVRRRSHIKSWEQVIRDFSFFSILFFTEGCRGAVFFSLFSFLLASKSSQSSRLCVFFRTFADRNK